MNKADRQKELYLYRTYGITYGAWLELLAKGCWICGKKEGRLNIDHRHVKNYKKLPPEEKGKEVRGCLCYMCNRYLVGGLERRKNARELLQRTVAYFKIFKMKGDL